MFLKRKEGYPEITSGKIDRSVPYIYVVVGDGPRAGTVKSLPFHKQMGATHMLNTQFVPSRGEHRIELTAEYQERNWALLDDLYAAEGRDEDKQRFYRFQEHYQGQGPDSLQQKYKDCLVPGFPDERLPKRCVDLSKGRHSLQSVYDPETDTFIPREQLLGSPEATPDPEVPETLSAFESAIAADAGKSAAKPRAKAK